MAEISPALVAKFEKLGARWKSLLPRLAKARAGTNGASHAGGAAPTKRSRRRAPAKAAGRRRR